MFFTQEDYKKIQKWILANSIKDTEFVGATLPLKGNETVAFVQDGKNVNVFLRDLIGQIFLLGVSDFLNVTDKYGESMISLTQAIQLIPYRSRKIGQVITFLDENGDWSIFQFQGERLNQWNNTTLWVNLIKKLEGISIIDSEDITASVDNLNQVSLTFADKNYNTADYSGLGRVYLRKNIQRVQNPNTDVFYNTNLLTQQMMTKENTIYIIQYDYSLNFQTITIPDNSVLLFEGGSISSGTINFTNTLLEGNPNITTSISGTLRNNIVKPEWFGAKGDGVTNDSVALQSILDLNSTTGNGYKIELGAKTYKVNVTVSKHFDIEGCGLQETILVANDTTKPIITNTFANLGWHWCTIRGVKFQGGTTPVGIGMSFSIPNDTTFVDVGRVVIDACEFDGLDKAIYKNNGNIGVVLKECTLLRNNYAWYAQDSYRAGFTEREYAGYDYFLRCYFALNNVGIAVYDRAVEQILIRFEGTAIESGGVGMLFDTQGAQIKLEGVWMEQNNKPTVVERYDKTTVTTSGDIVLYTTRMVAENIRYSTIKLDNSHLKIENSVCFTPVSDQNPTGGIIKDANSTVLANGSELTRTPTVTISDNIGFKNEAGNTVGWYDCYIVKPGSIIAPSISDGNIIRGVSGIFPESYYISGGTVPTTVQDGGLSFSKSTKLTIPSGVALASSVARYPISAGTGKYYLATLQVRLDEGSYIYPEIRNADESQRILFQRVINKGRWVQLAIIVFLEGTGKGNCWLQFNKNADEDVTFSIGHTQLIEFDNYEAAWYYLKQGILAAPDINTMDTFGYNLDGTSSRYSNFTTRYVAQTCYGSSTAELCRFKLNSGNIPLITLFTNVFAPNEGAINPNTMITASFSSLSDEVQIPYGINGLALTLVNVGGNEYALMGKATRLTMYISGYVYIRENIPALAPTLPEVYNEDGTLMSKVVII